MKILLAIDGSDASAAPLHEVENRPWPPGSQVRVLSVADSEYPPPSTFIPEASTVLGTTTTAGRELWREAEARVEAAARELGEHGLSAEAAVRRGNPQRVIVDEAEKWGADLIVVGSHGRTGLRRVLLGSVAQAVVRSALCSVEVVRERGSPVRPG